MTLLYNLNVKIGFPFHPVHAFVPFHRTEETEQQVTFQAGLKDVKSWKIFNFLFPHLDKTEVVL